MVEGSGVTGVTGETGVTGALISSLTEGLSSGIKLSVNVDKLEKDLLFKVPTVI